MIYIRFMEHANLGQPRREVYNLEIGRSEKLMSLKRLIKCNCKVNRTGGDHNSECLSFMKKRTSTVRAVRLAAKSNPADATEWLRLARVIHVMFE